MASSAPTTTSVTLSVIMKMEYGLSQQPYQSVLLDVDSREPRGIPYGRVAHLHKAAEEK